VAVHSLEPCPLLLETPALSIVGGHRGCGDRSWS
jgi:hypothetical protein